MLAVGALLVGSACAAEESVDQERDMAAFVEQTIQEARNEGWSEQVALLEDGEVSRAEYEQAVERAIECVTDAGAEATEPTLNRIDNLILEFSVTATDAVGEDEVQTVTEDCLSRYLWSVEGVYQQTHMARLDEPIRELVLDCARNEGLPVSGDEINMAQLDDSIGGEPGDNRETIVACATDAHRELYPDESVGIGW